jgi:hypothetical protein
VRGYTQEAGEQFNVREEFADEGKQHRIVILTGFDVLPASAL